MYYNVALNKEAYKNKDAATNDYADKVKQLFSNDSLISLQYHQLNNGKWNHMMDQTHIGYTYWQQPPFNKMPEVKYLSRDSVIPKSGYIPFNRVASSAIYLVPKGAKGNVFYECEERVVSIEAAHFSKTTPYKNSFIKVLPNIGRTGDGVTVFPVTATTPSLVYAAPKLEYDFYVYDTGNIKLQAYFSPTLNFHNDEGLKYAIAIDNELPQVIYINKEDNNVRAWGEWVANNIIIKTSGHTISTTGKHILKCWLVSPGAVLQKLVINFGDTQQTYLGPPETIKK
jgi:hypothetical protein